MLHPDIVILSVTSHCQVCPPEIVMSCSLQRRSLLWDTHTLFRVLSDKAAKADYKGMDIRFMFARTEWEDCRDVLGDRNGVSKLSYRNAFSQL